jgi:hypothetical protein
MGFSWSLNLISARTIDVPLASSLSGKMAKERSDLAVVSALAPVRADKFRALPDADAKKVALSKVDSWKRRDEFPKELDLHRSPLNARGIDVG